MQFSIIDMMPPWDAFFLLRLQFSSPSAGLHEVSAAVSQAALPSPRLSTAKKIVDCQPPLKYNLQGKCDDKIYSACNPEQRKASPPLAIFHRLLRWPSRSFSSFGAGLLSPSSDGRLPKKYFLRDKRGDRTGQRVIQATRWDTRHPLRWPSTITLYTAAQKGSALLSPPFRLHFDHRQLHKEIRISKGQASQV